MTTRTEDELISVREAAKECGRTMETVRRWIWGGKLSAQKLGNQLFIKRGDLAGFCREKAVAQYEAKPKSDWFERALALQERQKARGLNFDDADEMVGEMRGERAIDEGIATGRGEGAVKKETFITDNKGRKRAVILDVKRYREILEDLADLRLLAERKDEATSSLEEVESRLKAHGLL